MKNMIDLRRCAIAAILFLGHSSSRAENPPPGAIARGSPVRLLRGELSQMGQSEQLLAQRATKVQSDFNALLRDVQATQPAQNPETKPPATEGRPQRMDYRPPFRRLSNKTTLGIVCENDRISVLDYPRFVAALGPVMGTGNYPAELEDSDFHFLLVINPASGANVTLSRKQGAAHRGETLFEAQQPGSRFQSFLQSHDSQEHYAHFEVYPDSQETFRKARKLIWTDFDVNWTPRTSGEPIRGGFGQGSVQ
jgi:hypothetical protein